MKPISIPAIPKEKMIVVISMIAIFAVVGLGNRFFENTPPAPVLQLSQNSLTLQGRGGLPPLDSVATKDQVLNEMLSALKLAPPVEYFTRPNDVNQMIVDILFRWTGSDMMPAQSFGPYIDARVIGVLKRLGVAPDGLEQGTVIEVAEAGRLQDLWFQIYDHYRIRLLTQIGGKVIYSGGVTYDINKDSLNITGPISPDFIGEFQLALKQSGNSGEVIRALLDYVDRTKGFTALSNAEQDMIMGLKP